MMIFRKNKTKWHKNDRNVDLLTKNVSKMYVL